MIRNIAVVFVCVVGTFLVDSLIPLTEADRAYVYIGGVVIATVAVLVYDSFDDKG